MTKSFTYILKQKWILTSPVESFKNLEMLVKVSRNTVYYTNLKYTQPNFE